MNRVDAANKRLMSGIMKGFWNVHILHHAAEKPLYAPGMAEELREHGYSVNTASLHPILRNLARLGLLRIVPPPPRSLRRHKDYCLTQAGRKVLRILTRQVRGLHREIACDPTSHSFLIPQRRTS